MKNFGLLILLACLAAHGQRTLVTAVVKDANGSLYTNCTGSASFVNQNTTPGSGPPNLGGSTFQTVVPFTCDSKGVMGSGPGVTLADNNAVQPQPSQWRFSICAPASISSFSGTAPPLCFSFLVTITGTTQDITSVLQPLAPLLPVSGGGGGGGITGATPNGGLVQSGTTLGMLLTCSNTQVLSWNGTAWVCTTISGITGATANGGLTQTGTTLGLLTTCTNGQFLLWNGTSWGCGTPATAQTILNTATMVATQNGETMLGPILPGGPPAPTGVGTQSNNVIYPQYTTAPSPPGYAPFFGMNHFFSTASTNSVIGVACCFNGNNSVFPILGFSSYTMKFLINPYGANTRYWWGLMNFNVGSGLGQNNVAFGSTTAYVSNLPNKTTLGWRAAGTGVDTNFQAVEIQATTTTPISHVIDTGVPVDLAIHTYTITLSPTTGPATTVTWAIDGTVVATAPLDITTTLGSQFDLLSNIFWCADNNNTATLVGATLYYAIMNLLR